MSAAAATFKFLPLASLQRALAIAILSICLTVCPFITWADQSKTVQARITKSSPLPAWKTLV